ncbi:Uncharacterised protein [Algoriella xinjiangensis]|uniref:hypothetical protein n=1 Tax=Algoriella xinjiangensis TaxID=684065 RepID=UPI000F644BB8|nr:hypothetical protein [Algoriella xinjiangensis]VDH16710.1 Uncharacterised protein [Algoriella xinjiangensis]
MKQINIQLISLNKTKFEKSLFFITLLSLLALVTTVLELHFVPNLLNLKPEIIKNTNNLINDLSIGIIASFIFYVIVQWIPERNKEKKSLIIVEKNLIKLTNEIDFFILTYSDLLMNKKDINTLVKSDFDKIGFFELYKCESEFVKQFNTNRDEVIYVLMRLKTIFTEIGIILKSPYIEHLPDDLILKFYELRDLDFS